ncbi:hypothetical protein [Pandoraea sputorum]|uniref:Uncharacterized protein n=1 Tax=Pandoraea sputorum TaxID=93222 RepID=A0A239SXB3_9BURK|nr:hypothetical protein [Pandoraea sputorum]SNU89468.1 Uncharacterised protein [Pandoraea sputorum]
MMKRIHFFATRNDMLAVTDLVERKIPVTYVRSHQSLFPEYRGDVGRYESAVDIPRLGDAVRGQTSSCERYIVVNRFTRVDPVARTYRDETVEDYELGNCPEGVELNAGGFWEGEVLINGLIQTWSEGALGQQLMRKFLSSIKTTFKVRLNGYWIGLEAYQFLEGGGRLTLNVDANSSFDITLP